MGASVRVPDFVASRSGLAFANSFPSQPDVSVRVPVYGTVNIGDASKGVCGGMVFTVLDLREFGRPPFPDTEPPPADSPLFHYIVGRLIDSWDLPTGVLRYLSWMNTPDGDRSLFSFTRRGVWRRTLVDEWPKVRAAIDNGRLCPLGLVTVESRNPNDLGANHQVLAYGYDLDDDAHLTLHVYDPNTRIAHADDVWLKLSVGDPRSPGSIDHDVNIGHPIRGFFEVPYSPRDPAQVGQEG